MVAGWVGPPPPDVPRRGDRDLEKERAMLTIQNYVQAESLEQAWQLNQKKSTRILGGMLWLKMAKNTVGTAVDLCRLGLDAIEEDETQFSLGAMVTLR